MTDQPLNKQAKQPSNPRSRETVKTVQQTSANQSEKTIKIVTVEETSPQSLSKLPWDAQDWRSPNDDYKPLKQPIAKKLKRHSRPFFFWEALITVGLLVMALWMQTLPARQTPETINNESIPLFKMMETQPQF